MDYPSNSSRALGKETKVTPAKAPAKKIEKVVTGEVVRRKQPLGRRFRETFMGGDARGVAGYVFLDVLVPAAKDMVADAMSQGVEKMLFGEVRSTSRRTGVRPSGPGGHVSYNRYSSPSGPLREDPRQISRQARGSHNFDEIIIPTRGEAEDVIDKLFALIEQYEVATVADLYELVGVTGNYTDEKWGWTDIRGSGATRVRNGYLLELPRPNPLN